MSTLLFLSNTLKLLLTIIILDCSIILSQSNNQMDNPDSQYWDDQFGIVGAELRTDGFALKSNGNDLYIGGGFSIIGNVVANGVAKWDGKLWSNLGEGIDIGSGSIYALEIVGDDLYVGGKFNEISGIEANNIAKCNLLTRTWSALEVGGKNGLDSKVRALASTDDGDLYIGGEFTAVSGSASGSAKYIVMWDGEGWYTLGEGLDYHVNAIAIYKKSVYVGGRFSKLIAEWNRETNTWITIGQGENIGYYVQSVAVDVQGDVFIGGRFSLVADGTGINKYVKNFAVRSKGKWLPIGKVEYRPNINTIAIGIYNEIFVNNRKWWRGELKPLDGWEDEGGVKAIEVDQNRNTYFAGNFEKIGDVMMNNITRWDYRQFHPLDGGKANGLVGDVSKLYTNKNNLYAVGYFTTGSSSEKINVAMWNGIEWTILLSGINAIFNVVTTDMEGNVYVSANRDSFKEIAGVRTNGIAKWDGKNWQALGIGDNSGINGEVKAIVVDNNGIVYAGGRFGSAGGTLANNIAKWKPDKNRWAPLGSGINGTVSELCFDEKGVLYIGGRFSKAGDISANNIAKWDGNEWVYIGADSLNNGVGGSVNAIDVDGEDIYVGGDFTKAGNKDISHIAKYSISTGQWSSIGDGLPIVVYDILVFNKDHIYVAGHNYSGPEIYKWDGKQWHSFGISIEDGYVHSIVSSDNHLYISGRFSKIGSKVSYNIAKWLIPINSADK